MSKYKNPILLLITSMFFSCVSSYGLTELEGWLSFIIYFWGAMLTIGSLIFTVVHTINIIYYQGDQY